MIDDISLLKYCSYQYYSVVIMLLPISHFSLPRSLSQLRHNIQDLRKKILFFSQKFYPDSEISQQNNPETFYNEIGFLCPNLLLSD